MTLVALRLMKYILAGWVLLCATCAQAASHTPAECASCHPAEVAQQEKTAHAHAMLPALESAMGEHLPSQPLHESAGGFQFAYRPTPSGISVSVFRGNERSEGLIEWVMGAGVQGQTPLIRTASGLYESRISYFPQVYRYGITIGHPAGISSDSNAALGFSLDAKSRERCFGCHTTGGFTRTLQPIEPGVHCARCHSGAENHALGRGVPLNPGKLDAKTQALFCGNCHRSSVLTEQEHDAENVRFQPYRLMKSACFASGKLACTTCHSGHADAVRNNHAFYIAKCVTCHPGTTAHADGLEKADCIACHMPRVSIHTALKFTDHYIRVVKQ